MSSPFPDLPRDDCQYTPTVEEYTGPLVPKPLWTGASSYNDPNYPHGGGADDVPAAPPPFGEATPATISPPAQTSVGGAGGDSDILLFENGGATTVVLGDILMVSGCVGWSITNSCLLLAKNLAASNLIVFQCISDEVVPGATGNCYCLSGKVYMRTLAALDDVPSVNDSFGADTAGKLLTHQIGFRVIAIDSLDVYFVKDIMPSQILRVVSVSGTSVSARAVLDSTGALGTQNIAGKRTGP